MKFLAQTSDIFEEYHVPSGPRLDFGSGGAGAENTYELPSQFDKFKFKNRKKCTFGGIQRFKGSAQALSARYSEPGPGQYDPKDSPPKPTSKYGMIGPLSHKDRRDGLLPGQGMTPRPGTSRASLNTTASSRAQLLDSLNGEFSGEVEAAGPPRTARSLPAGQKRPMDARALSARGSSRRPFTAPNDRLDFGPMGQGGMYHVFKFQTEIDRAALKLNIPTSSMGTSNRPGRTRDYFPEPGPGAYSTMRQWGRSTHNYTSPMATPRSRLDYGSRVEDGNSGFSGRIGSQFDKAASRRQAPSSSFGTSQRFGKGKTFSDTLVPGPSSYQYDIDTVRKTQPTFSFASPRMRPPGYRNRSSVANSRDTSKAVSRESSTAKPQPAHTLPRTKTTASRDISAAHEESRDVVEVGDENFASAKPAATPRKVESQPGDIATSAAKSADAGKQNASSADADSANLKASADLKQSGDGENGDVRLSDEKKGTDQAGDASKDTDVGAQSKNDDSPLADAKEVEAGTQEDLAALDV